MNIRILLLWIPAFVVPLAGCDDDGNGVDCEPLAIQTVYPYYGAVDGPVLIEGRGFAVESLQVRFGAQQAQVIDKTDTYITTKVPSGLLGVVELSVTNSEGCTEVVNFEILNASGTTFPSSPPVYFIPPAGYSFPVQIPMDQELTLINVYDAQHILHVQDFREVVSFDEDINANYELWDEKTNPITGSINIPENQLLFEIDRSDSGEEDDQLVGGFYTMTAAVNGITRTDNFFLAFSTITRRQYLFYKDH